VISDIKQVSGNNKQGQVITCRSQVSSNSMIDNKHRRCHDTGKQYRYKGSVRIQKKSNDTRDQYEHKKIVPI